MTILSAYQVTNGLAPVELPKGMPVDFAMTTVAGGLFNLDITLEELAERISYVQTMFVDNAENPNKLFIATGAPLAFILKVPAFSQAILPVYSGFPLRMQVSSRNAASAVISEDRTVPAIIFNIPQPIAVWSVS